MAFQRLVDGSLVQGRARWTCIWMNRHLALGLDVPTGGYRQSGLGVRTGAQGARILHAASTSPASPCRPPEASTGPRFSRQCEGADCPAHRR